MSSSYLGISPNPGTDISGVIYRYTAIKDPADDYTVSIQNEDAIDGGFVFQSTDDWSGRSGSTINRYIPVPYSPIERWGRGSITETGVGDITDPTVLYTYRYEPQPVDIELPPSPTYDPYDALSDSAVALALEETDLSLIQDDEVAEAGKDEDEKKERLETALAASENALTLASGTSQAALLQAMNTATNLNGYYAAKLQGGKYQETVVLIDKNIPDNRRALRSLGQQKLHNDMVDQQYGR